MPDSTLKSLSTAYSRAVSAVAQSETKYRLCPSAINKSDLDAAHAERARAVDQFALVVNAQRYRASAVIA